MLKRFITVLFLCVALISFTLASSFAQSEHSSKKKTHKKEHVIKKAHKSKKHKAISRSHKHKKKVKTEKEDSRIKVN